MRTRLFAIVVTAVFASPLLAAQRPLAVNAFPHPVPAYLAQIINEAARQYDVDPNLVAAVAFHESRFQARQVSSIGAGGLMQLMPSTAKSLGVRDLFDPKENVFGGTKYLKKQLDRFGGDVDRALAAYNMGWVNVQKNGPGVAAQYVSIVKGLYNSALRAL